MLSRLWDWICSKFSWDSEAEAHAAYIAELEKTDPDWDRGARKITVKMLLAKGTFSREMLCVCYGGDLVAEVEKEMENGMA